jgi:hypothetical protein
MPKCVACLTGKKWECIANGNCDAIVNTNCSVDNVGTFKQTLLPEGVQRRLSGRNSLDSEESDSRTGNDSGDELLESDKEGYVPGKPSRLVETYKDDSVLKDQQSTGRKRAAQMYPLYSEEPCEWQKKKNCGGNKPIVGCVDGKQEARHHGPDKNTLNNDEGNVHRICHKCHNRWHTVNDEGYVWGSIYDAHSPVDAPLGEFLQNEIYWSGRSVVKAKD